MAVKRMAALLLAVAVVCGGCTPGSWPVRSMPTAMPLTAENVANVRLAVNRVKATSPHHPTTRDEYIPFVRAVYVASWAGDWSVPATTETALAKAKAGDAVARAYLTIVVYDLQLQAAMEGVSLSLDDWRAIYVRSGIMTDAAFAGYASLARGDKVLP